MESITVRNRQPEVGIAGVYEEDIVLGIETSEDQVPGHEGELSPERTKKIGKLELRDVYVRNLVCLPQVRKDENSEFTELKEDIKSQGMIHPISVTRLTQEQLEEYIRFVNHIWETDVKIEEYLHQRHEDGMFWLVVAGHSRTKALRQLEAEDGKYDQYEASVSVRNMTDPATILGLQISENTYSQPNRERRAMGIVGVYTRGKKEGEWDSPEEFRKKNGKKFSSHVLKEAIGFAALPAEARSFVFSSKVKFPYSVAAEIGMSAETIMQFAAKKIKDDPKIVEPTTEHFDEAFRSEVVLLMIYIQTEGMNITRAKKYVRDKIKDMQEMVQPSGETQAALFSTAEMETAYLVVLEKKYKNAIRKMAKLSVESVAPVIELAEKLKRGEARTGHEDEYEVRAEKYRQLLGEMALEETARAV